MKIQKRSRKPQLKKVKNDGSEKMILWFVIPSALAAVVFLFRKQLGLGTRLEAGQSGTYNDPNFRARK